jgi:hypothetical protein
MATGKREAIDLATLNDVKPVSEIRPQADARATLPDALNAIQTDISEIELLRHLTVKLRAELYFITLIQESRVGILRIAEF